jgi:hypothetical protein
MSQVDLAMALSMLRSDEISPAYRVCGFRRAEKRSLARHFVFAILAFITGFAVFDGRGYAIKDEAAAKKPQSPTEALWVVDDGAQPVSRNDVVVPSISIFEGKQLDQKTGVVQSKRIFVNPAVGSVEGLAFDSSHNLWFSLSPGVYQAGELVEVDYGQIQGIIDGELRSPSEVIADPTPTFPEYLAYPGSLAFDPSGDLWVFVGPNTGSRQQATALIEYTGDQLAQGGAPTPTAVIETPDIGIYGRPAMTFDNQGNLWQAGGALDPGSVAYNQTVVEYTAAQLAAGVQTDPYQTLIVQENAFTGSPAYPSSDVFDKSGNLWVAFGLGLGGVEMFSASELTGEGTSTPVPAITINAFVSGKFQDFSYPNGIAFDDAGDLWVANNGQLEFGRTVGSLVEFSPSQLTSTGSPLPLRMIIAGPRNGNLAGTQFITFGPPLPQ